MNGDSLNCFKQIIQIIEDLGGNFSFRIASGISNLAGFIDY